MEPHSTCALCCKITPLKTSHVIPAFVFRWARETSGTGHVRLSTQPNKRAQDGLKFPWLCEGCEQRLGGYERAFANNVFHPITKGEAWSPIYDDWMLKFCCSVSWRILRYHLDQFPYNGFSNKQAQAAALAEARWRQLLLGGVSHPAAYEQHLLMLGPIQSAPLPGMPNSINRYLLRAVEIDLVSSPTFAATYAKMGRFVVFGIIQPGRYKWKGTKVQAQHGTLRSKKYVLSEPILDLFYNKAERYGSVHKLISETQHKKIEEAALKDPHRFIATDQYMAMLADERMFGREALIRRPPA